jgi:hypothetical protein
MTVVMPWADPPKAETVNCEPLNRISIARQSIRILTFRRARANKKQIKIWLAIYRGMD